MSRVTLGASLVLAVLCLSLANITWAQSEGGEGGAGGYGAAGGEGGAGGYGGAGGEGGYGATDGQDGGRGEYGGRGGYGGEYGGRGGYGRAGGRGAADDPFGFGGAGAASAEADGERRTPRRRDSAAKDIEAALDSKLKAPLQYEDQPLNEVIDTLQEEYNIPILFDIAALEEVAISPDSEVSINLRNVTLRSALRLMLRQPGLEDLTFVIDDEVLLITTHEKANETLEVTVYRVDDLVSNYPQQRSGENDPYSSLVQVITSCVEYDTWMENGKGEGEVQLMLPGMLVVSQTRRVHDQVHDLLEKLRATHQEIEQSSSGAGMGGRGGGRGGKF